MNQNDYHKRNSFDTIMFSDPEHMIFVYSPQVKHLRLLELEKCCLEVKDYVESEYSGGDMHMHRVFNMNQEESQWVFRPKRCFLLDSQMSTVQKQSQGRPISYHRRYQKILEQQLKKKIFNWYSESDSILIEHCLTQQYYNYEEISNFCFGRRHFVRGLNSIELSSDHISRNHCEIAVVKGRGTTEIRKYFELLFGRQKEGRRRTKVSRGNGVMFIPMQLWQKIYEYVFLTRDKYYMLDSGSRNGSFFIQCPLSTSLQQPTPFEYNIYGNKIEINHKLLIREGFSYEYQGEEYLMKVWRLTHDRMKMAEEEESPSSHHIEEIVGEPMPLYLHNRKTIRNVQEFEEKINWFNNFQKVSKDYIIDEALLKRNLWKGKKVYEEMIKENFHKQKVSHSPQNSPTRNRSRQHYEEEANHLNENRPNESYQPFSLLPPNPTSPSTQYITKAEFVRLIYQEYVLMQKILKNLSKHQQFKLLPSKSQQIQTKPSNTETKTYHNPQNEYERSSKQIQNLKSDLFIMSHQLNAMVISLDFNNDFKKLYCIITQINKPKRFHIGSQMIINTARFEFDDHNKCNGYIEFNGKNWFIVALKSRNQPLQQNNAMRKKVVSRSLTDSEESDQETELDQTKTKSEESKQKSQKQGKNVFFAASKSKYQPSPKKEHIAKAIPKQGKNINLQKHLSNKIWTKIPSMSQYQLNPFKCSRYIIRLAHAFYFQLKFNNFIATSDYENEGQPQM